MTRTNIYLTNQSLAALRALSSVSGLTVAEQVRRAIDQYLASAPKPAPHPLNKTRS